MKHECRSSVGGEYCHGGAIPEDPASGRVRATVSDEGPPGTVISDSQATHETGRPTSAGVVDCPGTTHRGRRTVTKVSLRLDEGGRRVWRDI